MMRIDNLGAQYTHFQGPRPEKPELMLLLVPVGDVVHLNFIADVLRSQRSQPDFVFGPICVCQLHAQFGQCRRIRLDDRCVFHAQKRAANQFDIDEFIKGGI